MAGFPQLLKVFLQQVIVGEASLWWSGPYQKDVKLRLRSTSSSAIPKTKEIPGYDKATR